MDLLNGIRIFKRVAETKSFSKVAAELNVTQPTISKTIQALEVELGLSLFRRSTRGLTLTVEGQKLYVSGGNLIDHFERVLSEVKGQKLNLTGELRIAVALAFARLVLTPLLTEFGENHPDVRLQFILSDGVADLIENNIDVAIRIGELADSSLRAVKIGTSRRAVYIAKSYIEKHGRPKSIADLKNHRLLLYSRLQEGPNWNLKDKSGRIAKLSFEPFLKMDGSDLMREAVLEGLGIAMLPTWMMMGPEREKTVFRLYEDPSHSPMQIFALTAHGRELNAKQRAIIDFLRLKFEANPNLSIR